MVCQRPRKVYSTLTPLLSRGFSAVLMLSLVLATRFVLRLISHTLTISVSLQSDVTPALIMKRIEAASGAKYSAHNEQARKFEPIAPVGSSYTPVGRPDISAMRTAQVPPKNAPSAPSGTTSSKPAIPTVPRPVFRGVSSVQPAGTGKAPAGAWEEEPPATPLPPQLPPAASRPPAVPSAPRPAFSVSFTFTH
jgi:hypothetical protein